MLGVFIIAIFVMLTIAGNIPHLPYDIKIETTQSNDIGDGYVFKSDIENLVTGKKKCTARQTTRHRRSLSAADFAKRNGYIRYSPKEMEEIFLNYYICIIQKEEGRHKHDDSVKAVLALEGQRVELKCDTCLRPDQDTDAAHVFWQRMRAADASITMIRQGKNYKMTKDFSLVIREIDVIDAGQYFCVKGDDAEEIYQVDVLFREPQRTLTENNLTSLLPAVKLVDHNLETYTHWSEWGECDQCGVVGRRMKFGTCMVQKIERAQQIRPVDIPVMRKYPDGVPCRSTVLIRRIAHLAGIRDRKSEVIVGKCTEECPSTPPPITVTDQTGNVVQIIEGGLHPLKSKPELPPMTKRRVKYEAAGIHLVLSCPTSDSGKVRWEREDMAINPATIRHQTKGRVFTDKLNRLHIKRLRQRDSSIYNCWRWKDHEAAIKVIVYQPFNENIKHYITYGGLVVTIASVILICFCHVCCRRGKRSR